MDSTYRENNSVHTTPESDFKVCNMLVEFCLYDDIDKTPSLVAIANKPECDSSAAIESTLAVVTD